MKALVVSEESEAEGEEEQIESDTRGQQRGNLLASIREIAILNYNAATYDARE